MKTNKFNTTICFSKTRQVYETNLIDFMVVFQCQHPLTHGLTGQGHLAHCLRLKIRVSGILLELLVYFLRSSMLIVGDEALEELWIPEHLLGRGPVWLHHEQGTYSCHHHGNQLGGPGIHSVGKDKK